MHFIVFICLFLERRWNSWPVSHSMATQKGWESYIMMVKGLFSPSEVNIVSLYQRNVPLQKNNLKFRKYELCSRSLYSLSLRRSIVYALPLPPASPLVPPHPSSPPAGGCSSSCPSVDERLWLSCKSVGRLQKGQPCKCLLTPADISEEES